MRGMLFGMAWVEYTLVRIDIDRLLEAVFTLREMGSDEMIGRRFCRSR
jgi:hypothetical protein